MMVVVTVFVCGADDDRDGRRDRWWNKFTGTFVLSLGLKCGRGGGDWWWTKFTGTFVSAVSQL